MFFFLFNSIFWISKNKLYTNHPNWISSKFNLAESTERRNRISLCENQIKGNQFTTLFTSLKWTGCKLCAIFTIYTAIKRQIIESNLDHNTVTPRIYFQLISHRENMRIIQHILRIFLLLFLLLSLYWWQKQNGWKIDFAFEAINRICEWMNSIVILRLALKANSSKYAKSITPDQSFW